MNRELTVKQKKLVKGIAEGKTKRQAAIDAGYSPDNPEAASVSASQQLKKPNVREAFLEAMDKAGITNDTVSQVLKDGLVANRVISAIPGTEANGGTVDFVDVPDHPTRLKAVKIAVDILGVEAAKQVNVRDQSLEDLLNLDDGRATTEAEDAG